MWGCEYVPFTGYGNGFGILAGLLLLALLVFLAARGFGPKASAGNPAADRRDSLEILKTRLAKGEIGVDEFNTLKNVL